MKQKLKTILQRRIKGSDAEAKTRFDEAIQTLPRITTETVAEHREKILGSARKYIYPLQHSKHRVVLVSTSLLAAVVVAFFAYCGLALYRFQSTSGFIYRVTQVVPFPVAKAGPDYVSYENYLFELRHYIHYYQTQQSVNFNSTSGKQQLAAFKKQALQQVIDEAFVKQLAATHHVSVSSQEVNNEITLVRNEDRLGDNEKVFENVLKEFWGWSLDDFKRELKTELLAQKVVSVLDTATHQRAQTALTQLQQGTDFATLAAQISDDAATKGNGGNFGVNIDKTTQNLPPQTISALLALQPGQISGIVNIGTGLEIDKVLSTQDGKIQAAHILFTFQKIDTYVNNLKAPNGRASPKEAIHTYIKLKVLDPNARGVNSP